MGQKPFIRLVMCAIAATASGNSLAEVRLTNDFPGGGYVSAYTLATGSSYTDATLAECSRARGRQNEPSVAVNPRNIQVIIGSSNDYCGVYNDGDDANGAPIPSGPIWLGYYRSENSGGSFRSSLVPGYPDDASPYAALANIRTASSGDPVVAWDGHGRVFMGSESSGDPAGAPRQSAVSRHLGHRQWERVRHLRCRRTHERAAEWCGNREIDGLRRHLRTVNARDDLRAV